CTLYGVKMIDELERAINEAKVIFLDAERNLGTQHPVTLDCRKNLDALMVRRAATLQKNSTPASSSLELTDLLHRPITIQLLKNIARSPVGTFILSLLMPGLGQMLTKKLATGLIVLVSYSVISRVVYSIFGASSAGAFGLLVGVISGVDAYRAGQHQR